MLPSAVLAILLVPVSTRWLQAQHRIAHLSVAPVEPLDHLVAIGVVATDLLEELAVMSHGIHCVHQKTERVEAHILVCFLTLAMWRSLEMWMKSKGLGNCARQLIKEVSTVRIVDVILPVRDQGELNLRVVSRPDKQVALLLAHLGIELPSAPKIISNVVAKID